ncbi:MAG: hypothetical protein R3F11_20480 [Verrucomicrobiales bacterium]
MNSFATYDDGSGEALYVGGYFESAGGSAVSNLAKWDGAAWSDVGGGVNGVFSIGAMQAFDDGRSGPQLYVGGTFSLAGGNSVRGWRAGTANGRMSPGRVDR